MSCLLSFQESKKFINCFYEITIFNLLSPIEQLR